MTLSDLPEHDVVNVGMLLAIIDSWDNTETFDVRLDGELIFSHRWQLASGDSSSYQAPENALLSSGSPLGFGSGDAFDRDRAYDLTNEPSLNGIPHTSDSLTLEFVIGSTTPGVAAENWEGGNNESWAIDNLTVSVLSLIHI